MNLFFARSNTVFARSLSLAVAVLVGLIIATPVPLGAGAAVGPPLTPSENYHLTGAYDGPCASAAAVSTACPAGMNGIDISRADEGIVPMSLPTNFSSLTAAEQVFVVTNLERVDRGLAPISGLASNLDAVAQAGAVGDSDPALPTYGSSASANWGFSANIFTTDQLWMYEDGWAGRTTTNEACSSPTAAGCWAHRDFILGSYASPSLMGVGVLSAGQAGESVAQVFVGGDTRDTPYFTWASVVAHLPVGITDTSVNVSAPPGSSQAGSVQVWASGEAMNVKISLTGGNGDFSMNAANCTLSVGQSCQAAFGFSPPSLGEYTATLLVTGPNGTQSVPVVGVASRGYRLVAADGGVFTFGGASFLGATGNVHLNRPIVGMAEDPATGGYWLVASDGGIFSFGAPFFGSASGLPIGAPIVGMGATPDGGGYWLVTAAGGVYSFGDATYFGSGPASTTSYVGLAPTPDGRGYWLVNKAGGVVTFGDAGFFGSAGGMALNKPIVGITAAADGRGYWLVASDGGIFNYGDAGFHGSAGAIALNKPVVGMATTPDGGGYWLVASDGGVFNYGDAGFYGSTGGMALNASIVGLVIGQP